MIVEWRDAHTIENQRNNDALTKPREWISPRAPDRKRHLEEATEANIYKWPAQGLQLAIRTAWAERPLPTNCMQKIESSKVLEKWIRPCRINE